MAQLDIKLHKAQRDIFFCPSRFRVVCSGRRFGKSYVAIAEAIAASLAYDKSISPISQPVVALVTPTLKQGRQIFFKPLCSLLDGKPGVKIDRSDYRISIDGKPDILIRGFNDGGDALRGLKIYKLLCDEVQDFQSIEAIDATLMPAMADTPGSSATLTGTPKGKNRNTLYQLYLRTKTLDDWTFFSKHTSDNPFINRSEIERARLTLPERLFKQEFLANFEDFAGKICTEANKDKHFCDLSLEDSNLFYIGVDPGTTNAAMVLFGIGDDRIFRIYKTFYNPNNGPYTSDDLLNIATSLQHHCLRDVKRIFIPDDRADLVKTFRQGGLKQTILVRRNKPSPKERAEILNASFKCDRILINRSEQAFWDEIESYHRHTDLLGNITENIAPEQQDHRIDAFLYGCGKLAMDHPELLPHSYLIKNDDEDPV
jgi:hypothetical protein